MNCTYSVINNIAHVHYDSGGTNVVSGMSITRDVIGGVKTLTLLLIKHWQMLHTLVMVCDMYIEIVLWHTWYYGKSDLHWVCSLIHFPAHVREFIYCFHGNQLINGRSLLTVKLLILSRESEDEKTVNCSYKYMYITQHIGNEPLYCTCYVVTH